MTMNRANWLAERKSGIGSSDAAAVCGLSPWGDPYKVWLDKTGQLPEEPPSPVMEWGLRLENAIAEAYEQMTRRQLIRPLDGELHRHHEYPWMIATPDRLTRDQRLVELKTASAFTREDWGAPGTDAIPEAYIVQVQHQMAVTGYPVADVAVLIGGNDFRVYTVERSLAIIDRLIEIESAFWFKVQAMTPPEPDWKHPATPALIASLYGVEADQAVTLDASALEIVAEYERMKAARSEYEDAAQQAKAKLLHLMGDAAIGQLPDGRRITRKKINRKGYTVEPCSFIDFRIRG